MTNVQCVITHLTRSALGFFTFVVDDDGSSGMKSSSAIAASVVCYMVVDAGWTLNSEI